MNWADWAIVAVLAVSTLIGVWRGFVREALSLAVWVVAFIVAMLFYSALGPWFGRWVDTLSLQLLLAWVTLFVGTLLLGGLVNFLLVTIVHATGLGGTDRLLGMLFGFARGLLVVLALLIVLPGILPVTRDDWWLESALIPHFLAFDSQARDLADAVVRFLKYFIA